MLSNELDPQKKPQNTINKQKTTTPTDFIVGISWTTKSYAFNYRLLKPQKVWTDQIHAANIF